VKPILIVSNSKTCTRCRIVKSLDQFYKSDTNKNKSGFRPECKECKAKEEPTIVKVQRNQIWRNRNLQAYRANTNLYNTRKRTAIAERKLQVIRTQGCICPGCGFNYNQCPDKALLIIFEKSHVHNKDCSLRKSNYAESEVDEYFFSCRPCNTGKQGAKCGYWLAPNRFNQQCIL
jgi:hypothetical protein